MDATDRQKSSGSRNLQPFMLLFNIEQSLNDWSCECIWERAWETGPRDRIAFNWIVHGTRGLEATLSSNWAVKEMGWVYEEIVLSEARFCQYSIIIMWN